MLQNVHLMKSAEKHLIVEAESASDAFVYVEPN